MDTPQTHTPRQKPDDPTLVWGLPMTSAQAQHHWMTNGFVAVELYRVAQRQAKTASEMLKALKTISKMPCLTTLLGESTWEDSCGCASCVATAAITQVEKGEHIDE